MVPKQFLNLGVIILAGLPFLSCDAGQPFSEATLEESSSRPVQTPEPTRATMRADVVPIGKTSDIDLAKIGRTQPTGRFQDLENDRSEVVEQLVAHGKASIPYLISKLDDNSRVDAHVFDSWYQTFIGDIALAVLGDLFSAPGGTSTVPGMGWDELLGRGNNRDITAEELLRDYIKKHGRKTLKQKWENIWIANESKIHWDPIGRCFRIEDSK
ncbi:MAG: hypothetical protein ABI791_10810 [Acidobacteriota bacterium]